MTVALEKLSHRKNRRRGPRKPQPSRRTYMFEKLEDRQLLAGDSLAPGVGLAVVRQVAGDLLFNFEQRIDGRAEVDQRLRFGLVNDPGLRSGGKVTAIVGDWNRSGYDWPGVVIQHYNDGLQWKLDNDGDPLEEYRFFFGLWTDQFAVADVNGDGYDDIVVARPGQFTDPLSTKKLLEWHISYGPFPTEGSSGTDTFLPAHEVLLHGPGLEGDQIIVGDWNADGKAELGVISKDPVFSEGVWVYQWWLPMPSGVQMFPYGGPITRPIVGNWDGSGGDNIGVVWEIPGAKPLWQLDTNWNIHAEIESTFTSSGVQYLAGHWFDFRDSIAPTAQATSSNITLEASAAHWFPVTYRDNAALDCSTINQTDVYVKRVSTGQEFQPVNIGTQFSCMPLLQASQLTASYAINAPGGNWDASDNGWYEIYMRANEVRDASGNAVAAGKIGSFEVAIPLPDITPPTATLISLPVPKPNDPHADIQVRYDDSVAVKVASFDSSDIRVVGPGGAALNVTFVGSSSSTNGTPRTATYRLHAPGGTWDVTDNGTYTISLQASQISDTSNNWAVAKLLGQLPVSLPDVDKPQAQLLPLSAVVAGALQSEIRVEYRDNVAVNVASFATSNIRVTGPGSQVLNMLSVSSNQATNGTPRTATYRVQAPGGSWDDSDNGRYEIRLVDSGVRDTSNNGVVGSVLGVFDVNLPVDERRLSLTVAPTSISEDGGRANAVVTRTSLDLSQPLTVTLQSSDTSRATVPSQVIIPAGQQASSSFAVTAVDNHTYTGDRTVTITASAGGFTAGSFTIKIVEDEPTPRGMISGTVFHDRNRNMRQDTDEPGLSNRMIYLDLNGDGKQDAGEPSTQTNAAGWYGFYDLVAGTYQVRQQLPAGWLQTVPACAGMSSGESQVVNLTTEASSAPIHLSMPEFEASGLSDLTPQMEESLDLIRATQFRNDPRFTAVDGRGFSAVIIDTGGALDHGFFGPDANHDGVADRIVFQYDFAHKDADASDRSGHGTHVMSIVGSQDSDYPGVASGVNLIVLKVFRDSGGGDFAYVEDALQWVVQNVDRFNIASVNLSLGDSRNHDRAVQLYGLGDELSVLAGKDVVVLASAGNDYLTHLSRPGVGYPAADPNTIAVGAVWDEDLGRVTWQNGAVDMSTGPDRIVSFSQRHAALSEVFAPGALITAADLDNSIASRGGTSMAAPHVAGAAVLAQQLAVEHLGRRLTLDEFRDLVTVTGVTIHDGDDEDANVLPSGLSFPRLDILALAEGILAMKGCPHTVTVGIGESVNADFGTTQIVSSHATWAANVTPVTDAPWINQPLLTPIVDAARLRWQQAALSPLDAALLNRVSFKLGSLPGNAIAETLGTTVTLSGNAAGRGWFVDSTPLDDQEFVVTSSEMIAAPGDLNVEGRIDLLSVVMHEMGRFVTSGSQVDLQDETFVLGIRTIPTAVLPLLQRASVEPIVVCQGDPATIRLQLSGPTDKAVSLNYKTVPMTAGEDNYVPVTGTLVIPAGSVEGTIDVQTKRGSLPDGDATFMIQLTDSSDVVLADKQIFVTIQQGPFSAWQNPRDPMDVDDNGRVTPLDALVLINEINLHGIGPLSEFLPSSASNRLFVDSSGDGVLSSLDVLLVVNRINWAVGNLPSAASSSTRSFDSEQGIADSAEGEQPLPVGEPVASVADAVFAVFDDSERRKTSADRGDELGLAADEWLLDVLALEFDMAADAGEPS